MFGMSMTEILVILVIVLVVMGPEKIPDAARMAGKAMRELRKASNLLRDAVLIEDEPPKPKPKSKPAEPAATAELDEPRFDQMDFVSPAAAVAAMPAIYPSDPKKGVQVVAMSPRREPSAERGEVEEHELAPARADLSHREVYLHEPYEETH